MGIWVYAPEPDKGMALGVESDLIQSGLRDAVIHPNGMPAGLKGVVILVGYKAAPF
jgi:hypothetical protein